MLLLGTLLRFLFLHDMWEKLDRFELKGFRLCRIIAYSLACDKFVPSLNNLFACLFGLLLLSGFQINFMDTSSNEVGV